MNNSTIFKRIGAYLIDMVIITLIGMAITKLSFINPKYDEYKETSEKYNDMLMDYYDQKIETTDFNNKVRDISYDMNKSGAVFIGCDIVVLILYFGVFAFATHGETLGKKLMGLKIVSSKNKPLKIYNYIIRCIILNGVIMDVVTLIAINFNRNTYYNIYSLGSNLNMLLEVAIFISIMFTASGRGLHDFIAQTQVIDVKRTNSESLKENKESATKNIQDITTEVAIIKPSKSKTKKKEESKNE